MSRSKLTILHAFGARPNFVKVAPLVRVMDHRQKTFRQILVHTGQHYDDAMSRVFFHDLGLRNPDVNLDVGSGSHAHQTAKIMERFEPVVRRERPDWVVVYGDVNSTLACALVATKMGIPVAHVEAGLRSFDRSMPEETNRVLTDHMSNLLFTPSRDAGDNLRREGIPGDRIRFVGNIMIDSLVSCRKKAEARFPKLKTRFHIDRFCLVTLHRPSNVDDPEVVEEIVSALAEISQEMTVIFPVHPRTRERLGARRAARQTHRFHLIEPLGYLDFLALEMRASVVITDSGGIQEETTYLRVPCLTLRPNTERPITITHGTNRLLGDGAVGLPSVVRETLSAVSGEKRRPPLWDGGTARRIENILGKTIPLMVSLEGQNA